MFERGRTKPHIIRYALYLYFLCLSFRERRPKPFNHLLIGACCYRDWIQRFDPKRMYPFKNKKRIVAFLIDETQIQIGSTEQAWLWVAIEPPHRRILGVYIIYQDIGIF